LPFKPKVADDVLKEIKNCKVFGDIESFVSRNDTRRRLIRSFYPLPPGAADNNLTIVTGTEDSGKSWLATWCLEVCALLDRDVRYVEISDGTSKTWLDALLQIRGGFKSAGVASLVHRELDHKFFEQFYWELEHYSKALPIPVRDAEQSIIPKDDYKLGGGWAVDFEIGLIKLFLESLARIGTADNPLIIVFDHFENMEEDDMKRFLIPALFEPVAGGLYKSLKFILVLTESESRRFKIENLLARADVVSLELFDKLTFVEAIGDFLRMISKLEKIDYSEEKIEEAAAQFGALLKDNGTFKPERLKLLKGALVG